VLRYSTKNQYDWQSEEEMASTIAVASELAILDNLIKRKGRKLSPLVARAFLEMTFDERDCDRMHELGQKAQEGTLSPKEQAELNGYEIVGHFLAILHSRARQTLKRHGNS
jgi:hypothetical protein